MSVLFGLINLDKPAGITSRDAINHVQRLVRPHKVGHAGTLDPLATGVLVVLLGPATRLTSLVHAWPKRYRATFLLGRSSDTEDVEGQVSVNPDARTVTRVELDRVLPEFLGEIRQRPPAYSALKVQGRRAYELARGGVNVDLAERTIRIDSLSVRRFDDPELELEVVCGSGTYVRSLGRDLAARLGTSAVMSQLCREAIGPLLVGDAISPRDLHAGNLAQYVLPPAIAVRNLLQVVVSDDERNRIAHAVPIEIDARRFCGAGSVEQRQVAAFDNQGNLLAILSAGRSGRFQPHCNFVAQH